MNEDVEVVQVATVVLVDISKMSLSRRAYIANWLRMKADDLEGFTDEECNEYTNKFTARLMLNKTWR